MNVPTLNEMKTIVENRIVDLIADFEQAYSAVCKYPVTLPKEIEFTKRGGIAGWCSYHESASDHWASLNFNPTLMKENWDKFDQTVVHEVAHFCVFLMKGVIRSRAGNVTHHGTDWKRMMSFFGVTAERCHSYNTTSSVTRRVKRYSYKCDCMTHEVSSIIHNRMVEKGRRYHCRSCKSYIVFVG